MTETRKLTIEYEVEAIPPCCDGKDCACGGRDKVEYSVEIISQLPAKLSDELQGYLERKHCVM